MENWVNEITEYALKIDFLELSGLIFGLLAVYFLIKENLWTWPMGIAYVLVSFIIFWQQKLYADFALHVFFLVMNSYGWWFWLKGAKKSKEDELPVTTMQPSNLVISAVVSVIGLFLLGFILTSSTDASLPYWDSATTVLSLTGMWLSAKKKLENWYYWFVVDVLATGIYFYKGIYFYAILYLFYIGMAIAGYLAWKKTLETQ